MFSMGLILALIASVLPGFSSTAGAVSTNVVISEFRVRGPLGGNDEFIELYNLSTTAVDIGGWQIKGSNSSGFVSTRATIPVGTILGPRCHYLATNSGSNGYSGSVRGNLTYGTGVTDDGGIAITLPTGVMIDQVGMSAGSAFKEVTPLSSLGSTNLNRGYERKPGGALGSGTDTDNNSADFQVISPSDPQNLASPCIGFDAPPSIAGIYPSDGAAGVPINANVSVTFSEPVNVSGTWYSLACSASGVKTGAVSGGPVTFTIDPASDFVGGESCTLTVYAANVSDQDANDPPDNMQFNFTAGFSTLDACTLSFTPAYDIQGSGLTAAMTGSVTTQGMVVGDYEAPGGSGQIRGFYLQDLYGDGNEATSDGIFIFNGNNNSVNLGDLVRVTGTAGEFQDQTQISAASIVNCGSGSVSPVDVTFPVPSNSYLEQYEGMLVHLPQTLYVTEHFQLGRFGQVVVSVNGRLKQPTNVVSPGTPALALQAQNNLSRIIIDDGTNLQNPDPIRFGRGSSPLSASNTLRGGDTATGIVGVMTYTWAGNSASGNAYRVRPINALDGYVNFEASNPRPTAAPAVGGTLKVAGMNLLNFFNTFDGLPDTVDNCSLGVGGASTDCRGADTAAEFARQFPKTVAAILAMDADVIGVNEIENDGYASDSAIQYLVDQLNSATAPGTYAFIDADANTGQTNALGTDAIKVGMLYRPASVTPIGQTAVLNTTAFVNGGDSAPRSRPSLAQAFEQNVNGERFVVDITHLKSKGSACDAPDAGDGQGNCNLVRVNAAVELMNWLAGDPTGTGESDILLIGDYNSYAMEDPITVIRNAGFTNLIEAFLGPDAYSYVFDGQWGYLDHALGSASVLPQITGVGDYHINADEPSVLDYNTDFKSAGQIASLYAPDQFRVSDHDPVLVGLCLPPSLNVTVSPDSLWPPNHKYITVETEVDASSDATTISLLSVTSNEADNGLGDGDQENDIVVLDDFTFDLRAERSALGSGRMYSITYQATNSCGNTTVSTATVAVPLNQGR
jgi:predicted extracellular nuclease